MRAQAVAYVIIRAVSLKLYLQVASGFDTDFLMHILKKKTLKNKQTKAPLPTNHDRLDSRSNQLYAVFNCETNPSPVPYIFWMTFSKRFALNARDVWQKLRTTECGILFCECVAPWSNFLATIVLVC